LINLQKEVSGFIDVINKWNLFQKINLHFQ
jgi:hypothetical protein